MTFEPCNIREPHDPHRTGYGPGETRDCPGVAEATIASSGHAVGVAAIPPWHPYDPVAELREMPATALTQDQEIRSRALACAVDPYVGLRGDGFEADGLAVVVLDLATRFERYIRGPIDDTDPLLTAARAWRNTLGRVDHAAAEDLLIRAVDAADR